MITIVMGGQQGDTAFESWLREKCKWVMRFCASKSGDLAKFGAAVQSSCDVIVHKDTQGNVTGKNKANDPLVVHSEEMEWGNHVQIYVALAQDAGLDVQILEYKV